MSVRKIWDLIHLIDVLSAAELLEYQESSKSSSLLDQRVLSENSINLFQLVTRKVRDKKDDRMTLRLTDKDKKEIQGELSEWPYHVRYELVEHIESFLAMRRIQQDPYLQRYLRAEALSEKGLGNRFNQVYDDFQSLPKTYFYCKYAHQIEEAYFDLLNKNHQIKRKKRSKHLRTSQNTPEKERFTAMNFYPVIQQYELYDRIYRFRATMALAHNARVLGDGGGELLINQKIQESETWIKDHLEESTIEHPVLELYSLLLRASLPNTTVSGKAEYIASLEEYYEEHSFEFVTGPTTTGKQRTEQSFLFQVLIGHYFQKTLDRSNVANNPRFKLLEWYKRWDASGSMIQQNLTIHPRVCLSLLWLSCRLQDFDYFEDFLCRNEKYMEPELIEEITHFYQAALAFSEGDYNKVVAYDMERTFERTYSKRDYRVQMNWQVLLVKGWFMQLRFAKTADGVEDAELKLNNGIKRLNTILGKGSRRNEISKNDLEAYQEFSKLLKRTGKLVQKTMRDKKISSKIYYRISVDLTKSEYFSDRDWLINQLGELKKGTKL